MACSSQKSSDKYPCNSSKLLDKNEKSQNIQVAVRVRPLNSNEKKQNTINVISINAGKKEVTVQEKGNTQTKTFGYDKIFGPNSTQIEVYREVVVPILGEVLMGYNCTIFAYGQTGTGKTFTMVGERTAEEGAATWENQPLAGIIPRTLRQLFETLTSQHADFTIRVSFVELYNEEIIDLLGTEDSTLRLYDDPVRKGSVVIQGLEELIVTSKEEVYEILDRGATRRATAATLLNAQSSRSHSVFSITVHIRETAVDGEEMLKIGKLYLVDLAGSENIGRSGAVDMRAREAGSINQSLLTLGRVITALVEHARHIPYRESKLTRILQDSLGGRTKTSIIATISPSSNCTEETVSTLHYAFRARNITNKPEINKKVTKKTLLKEYAEEIDRLQRDLQAAREKHGFFIAEENYKNIMQKLTQQETLIKDLEERLEGACVEKSRVETLFASTQEDLDIITQKLSKATGKFEKAQVKLVEAKKNYLEAIKARDENEFLLAEHEQKQDILRSQAQELVDINEKAAQSIQLLHSKVDRTKRIKEVNESQLHEYAGKVADEVEIMKTAITTFSAVQHELGGKQTKHIGQLVQGAKRLSAAEAELDSFLCAVKTEVLSLKKCPVEELVPRLEALAMELEQTCKDRRQLNVVHKNMNSGLEEVSTTTKRIQDLVSNHEDGANTHSDRFKQITDEFVNCQFERDIETGTTPSRQTTQFRVLRNLANVTPRDALLERFREQYVAPNVSFDDVSLLEIGLDAGEADSD